MAIDPIPLYSYPLDNSQSIFSKEEYTALELAGKTANKMNEVVQVANGIEQNAIESRQIVDNMQLEQENFVIENSNIRDQILADNGEFIADLTASKETFEDTLTQDITSFKSDLNTSKTVFEEGLITSTETFETSMTEAVNDIITSADSTINTSVETKIDTLVNDGTIDNLINTQILGDVKEDIILNEKSINDISGVGVVSGLLVLAQSSPDMSVLVSQGIAHLYNGKRYTQNINQLVIIEPADILYSRIDIIYINSDGLLSYGKGEASADPIAPSPLNALILAEILIGVGTNSITTNNITNMQSIKKSIPDLNTEIQSFINQTDLNFNDVNSQLTSTMNAVGVNLSSFTTFSEALAEIGAQEKTLVVSKDVVITENTTINSNITLKFTRPFKLTVNEGVTLAIGGNIQAENYLIIDGLGSIVISTLALNKIEPLWFGGQFGVANTINGVGAGENLVRPFNHETGEGGYNTAIGYLSQNKATTPIGATSVGFNSLANQTGGIYNTAFGYSALKARTEGDYNTAIGPATLQEGLTGNNNTAVGFAALRDNSGGEYNTALGSDAMRKSGGASRSTAVGSKALYDFKGNDSTAVGERAGGAMTDGNSNSLFGSLAGYAISIVNYVTSIGAQSLFKKTTGQMTTAIGFQSGLEETTGEHNTWIGATASPNAGSGNINYATGVGSGATVSESNCMSLGGPLNTSKQVNVGIGIPNPKEKMVVPGRIAIAQGMEEPATYSGYAVLYVDVTGSLKLKLADGTVKTVTLT